MRIKIVSKKAYKEIRLLEDSFNIVKKNPDICIAIGGDGTFMNAAKECDCPILPIRTNEVGSLGYYADISLNDINKAVVMLKSHKYNIEPLSKKLVVHYKNNSHYAINEILLKNVSEEIYFSIKEIDGRRKIKISPFIIAGDGMLITSVMGSTAYHRSARGPIITSPKVMCITFINPDGPYTNPIIIDESSLLEITVEKYQGNLRADTEDIGCLHVGDSFRVSLSDKTLNVIRFPSMRESFSNKLKRMTLNKFIEKI